MNDILVLQRSSGLIWSKNKTDFQKYSGKLTLAACTTVKLPTYQRVGWHGSLRVSLKNLYSRSFLSFGYPKEATRKRTAELAKADPKEFAFLGYLLAYLAETLAHVRPC